MLMMVIKVKDDQGDGHDEDDHGDGGFIQTFKPTS